MKKFTIGARKGLLNVNFLLDDSPYNYGLARREP